MGSVLERARRRLVSRYIRGLIPKILALEEARDKLAEPEAKAEIRELAHQLRGSGASFGLVEISDAAGVVEDLSSEAGDDDLGRAVGQLVAVLEDMCAKVESASRVLIVEDDDDTAALLHDTLAGPSRVLVRAEGVAQAQKLLWAQPFDLVVLNLLLPDGDGRDLLVTMKRRVATSDVPVVALSGKYASHIKSECMALGVELFCEKPLDTTYLAEEVSQLLDRRYRRADEVGHDGLTGLRQKEAFSATFEQVHEFCKRTGIPLSLAILAIDDFESVSDRHGHAVAEDILVFVAGTIVKSLREEDFSGRWDGNEFAVVLLGAREEDAVFALSRIRSALIRGGFSIPGGKTIALSVSGGVVAVALETDNRDSLESALERARALIAHIRASGESRIIHTVSGTYSTRPTALVVENDFYAADVLCRLLEADDFAVTRCINGVEALETARNHAYSLVVLDKVLPEMDGFDLLELLRADARHRTTPIIMVTSAGEDEDIERGFALGADDYVVKPFRVRALRARLRRHARRHAQERS